MMRSLRSEVEAGITKPYSFVEINGLKLAAPENIYRVMIYIKLNCFECLLHSNHCLNSISGYFQVIYEALTGYRVSWKKALNLLNDKFSNRIKSSKDDDRPCILLIDELDLLVTRNQSVKLTQKYKSLTQTKVHYDKVAMLFFIGLVQHS